MRRYACLSPLLLACVTPQPVPERPPEAAPKAATETPADPCADVTPFESVAADAEQALEAHAGAARYAELAAALSVSAECDASPTTLDRGGRLIAAMGEDLFTSEADAARALFHAGFELLARAAEGLDDPALAAAAARLQYELLDRYMFREPQQPQPPRSWACKLESVGKCVYLPPDWPPNKPYDQDELDLLRAFEVYARFGDDPERVRAIRYMRYRLLAEHRDLGRELAAVEAFVETHDGLAFSAWTAFLLLDELTRRAFEQERRDTSDLEALAAWIERLHGMKLWDLDEADELHAFEPLLHAATWWALAEAAREHGDFAECADRYSTILARHVDHDHTLQALVNAADCLEADGRPGEADKLRGDVVRRFPDSDAAKLLKRSAPASKAR